ncbi:MULTISPECIES: RNA polymerase sigma factor [unclassified Aureispira]|uniref:RNA polymerase sigma factor n=1 Tax=unclassified Aureispira TaxID=2649989 RepID=UPI0006976D41|nr:MULTISPECIES: sigma-70 family RNA polymerase sigma factor [unclassified Aureispira]WMX13333.1 sigma-70 family RNA polymerase sigma factor [Aureispira sp. CCB-E]
MERIKNKSDEDLMRHVQEGAEWAFNELYQRYSQRILYFMYKMLRQDEAKAQDLLQDVFLKIVETPEKFDVTRNFKTWIFTVAANSCKNYFRAQKGGFLELEKAPKLTTTQASVELNTGIFQAQLNVALDELAYVYKEAFVLKYREGLSLQEIALVMNCPLGTVKSRLSSATKLLGKRLAPFRASLLTKD